MTQPGVPAPPCEAVLFDLLTALIDSWSLWDAVAGSAEAGRHWRGVYLRLTYGTGNYRPYEEIVAEAAAEAGLPVDRADALAEQWDSLAPWPEAPAVVRALSERVPVGVVTNCSRAMGRRAAALLGIGFDVIVTAEDAGAYKPDPRTYEAALASLGTDPARTLFVAGSPGDVPGAGAAGMPVVWHNRIGLPLPEGAAAPMAEVETLDGLPEWLKP